MAESLGILDSCAASTPGGRFGAELQAYIGSLLGRLRDGGRFGGRIDLYAAPAEAPAERLEPPACLTSLLRPFGFSREELLALAVALGATYSRELAERLAAIARRPGIDRHLMAALEGLPLFEIDRLYHGVFVDSGPLLRARLLEPVADAPDCREPSAALRSYLAGRTALPRGFEAFARLIDQPQAEPVVSPATRARLERLAERWSEGPPALTCIAGAPGSGRTLSAAFLAATRARGLLAVDVAAVPEKLDVLELEREACFLGATLLFRFADEIAPRWRRGLRRLAERGLPVIASLPAAAPDVELDELEAARLDLPAPDDALRARAWSAALPRRLRAAGLGDDQLAYRFRGSPRAIQRLARAVLQQQPAPITLQAVQETARHTGAGRLAQLGTRLERVAEGLEAVVLPAAQKQLLGDLVGRVRHRHEVLERWGFARRVEGGGVVALFSGPPGTGKSFSARAVASELAIPLYRIDLSAVVSKWVGETEKHLGEVFDQAEACGAALLFDEADALFARRGEVAGASDRHANLEVGFLLTRIEAFSGLCFLTTNLAANLDQAFIRRFSLHLRFELPELEERTALWRRALPDEAPCAPGVDLDALARRFADLSGADIRNSALRAAFYAAEARQPISRSMLEYAATEERSLGGHVIRQVDRPSRWT